MEIEIYGSFSANPGTLGMKRFNNAFKKNGINAIYKAFRATEIYSVHQAAKTIQMAGFALSMPLKTKALDFFFPASPVVHATKSINTVRYDKEGSFFGYNTDYNGIKEYILANNLQENKKVFIIGSGAFARTAKYVFDELGMASAFLNSRDENLIKTMESFGSALFFNASPLKGLQAPSDSILVDCDTNTPSGRQMSFYSARAQFYDVYGFPKEYAFEEVI